MFARSLNISFTLKDIPALSETHKWNFILDLGNEELKVCLFIRETVRMSSLSIEDTFPPN